MSLYSDYILEKTDKYVLESDIGFATYGFPEPSTVYLEEIFIKREHRKSHEASRLANEIIAIAKERGCTKMLGSVVPSTKNSTDSIRVLLAYGMSLDSSTNDFILFSREI